MHGHVWADVWLWRIPNGRLASGRAFVAACLSETPGPHLGGRCALTSLGQSQLAVYYYYYYYYYGHAHGMSIWYMNV